MRGIRVTAMAAMLLAGSALGARAADTFSGEVVDLSCYLHHPDTSHGASHKKCAETCAKKGLPMRLLTDDKQVYVVREGHQNPHGCAKAIEAAATRITVETTKAPEA